MDHRTDRIAYNDTDVTETMERDDLGIGNDAAFESSTTARSRTGDVSPADIHQTRAEMSETLSALGEKVSPQALTQEAKDLAAGLAQHAKDAISEAAAHAVQHVKDTLPDAVAHASRQAVHGAAKGASMSLVEKIKHNPVPAAVAGFGLYWLFKSSGEQTDKTVDLSRYRPTDYASSSYGSGQTYGQPSSSVGSKLGGIAGGVKDAAGNVAGTVHDAAGNAVDSVQDAAGRAVDSVQNVAGRAADSVQSAATGVVGSVKHAASGVADSVQNAAGNVSSTVQTKASQSTDWFQRTLQENPLAVLVSAAALGTVIGLVVPETEKENQLMGGTRDNLKAKAKDAVVDMSAKAHDAAGQVIDNVKESVGLNN